ncbi:MAG: PHP domain-containing protein, partial [Pseudomonadota bacterium]
MSQTERPEFIHLHVHSEFSLKDGLLKMKPLLSQIAAQHMPAVGLTDAGNLFALVKFYESACSRGIKPVLGAEVQVQTGDSPAERLVLLAMNNHGYKNLIHLVSTGFTEAPLRGVLQEDEIFAHSDGLIVLSGGMHGHLWQLAQGADQAALQERIQRWQNCFGDRYYLELTRTARPGEERVNMALLAAASALQVGVVATNDVCFAHQDDFEAHETRVCIHEGRSLDDPRRERR